MTSLRDIIRPSDAESDRYRRACDMSMGEYLRGEACGLSVVALASVLNGGLFLAAHHDPYARYPQWAREMVRGVRRALRGDWQ